MNAAAGRSDDPAACATLTSSVGRRQRQRAIDSGGMAVRIGKSDLTSQGDSPPGDRGISSCLGCGCTVPGRGSGARDRILIRVTASPDTRQDQGAYLTRRFVQEAHFLRIIGAIDTIERQDMEMHVSTGTILSAVGWHDAHGGRVSPGGEIALRIDLEKCAHERAG